MPSASWRLAVNLYPVVARNVMRRLIGLDVVLPVEDLLFETFSFVEEVLFKFAQFDFQVGVAVVVEEEGVGAVQK